jgi:GT2 family glycosyltransferase
MLPSVSIIIPAYNAPRHLDACLTALAQTLPDHFRGEILVVDDRSRNGTSRIAKRAMRRDARIRVLRNERNMGFLDTANRGARAATSEFLLFLNQDTIPLPGWLPPLLRTFRDFPHAGAVGGKLLFPDGRLQEAGGIVFRDGSAANVGRNDPNPDGPLYRFVREIDYCSGALLMTPRALFLEIGGFDERYGPGYYEDTDYCFSVRRHGKFVYYQPASQVIHIEGSAHGTDVTAGAKRYQVINSATFASTWAEALSQQPERPEDLSQHSWLADSLRGVTTGRQG